MSTTVALQGRLSDEAEVCPPCGTPTRRRLDIVTEDGLVLLSYSVCDTCQQPLTWGLRPAVWTEASAQAARPAECTPHD